MSQGLMQESFSLETGEIQDQEIKILTVSGLNALIKGVMEDQFAHIWLRGELSNFKAHSSGHLYFSLKDKNSQISAVMFRGYTRQLKFNPKDGLEVLVRGRISVYEPRGNYQVYVESMEPMGAGALQKAFEELKLKLQQEGLFLAEHKKELPFLPHKIALITSPTGAAVRDMIQVLGRRYKAAEIVVIPALTQGQGASESLCKAVETMDQMNFDVAIIGRGGGSIEDLWCFNDECLARAIFKCKTPIVSAVGHEIDFTICDFVADVRAPTPSAAAELVSKNVEVIKDNLTKYILKLKQTFNFKIKQMSAHLMLLKKSLVDPKRRLADLRLRCDELFERVVYFQKKQIETQSLKLKNIEAQLIRSRVFIKNIKNKLENINFRLRPSFLSQLKNKKTKFLNLVSLLDSLSPLGVMSRGFSIVRKNDDKGKIVFKSKELRVNDVVSVQLSEGAFRAKVEEVKELNK